MRPAYVESELEHFRTATWVDELKRRPPVSFALYYFANDIHADPIIANSHSDIRWNLYTKVSLYALSPVAQVAIAHGMTTSKLLLVGGGKFCLKSVRILNSCRIARISKMVSLADGQCNYNSLCSAYKQTISLTWL